MFYDFNHLHFLLYFLYFSLQSVRMFIDQLVLLIEKIRIKSFSQLFSLILISGELDALNDLIPTLRIYVWLFQVIASPLILLQYLMWV